MTCKSGAGCRAPRTGRSRSPSRHVDVLEILRPPPDADEGAGMADGVMAAQRRADILRVAQVAGDHVDSTRQQRGSLRTPPGVTRPPRRAHDRGPEAAGAASDKDAHAADMLAEMFSRQKTGSVVCSSCGSLVGVNDDRC